MKLSFNQFLLVLLLAVAAIYVGKYFYQKPKFVNGHTVPDFTAQTISGEKFTLSSLRGQYVLLDFWGSWCGPCRMENPNLVQLYNRYQGVKFKDGSQFTIVSVAIERNTESWKRAIAQDALSWPIQIMDQASNLRFINSPVALIFKIRSLPSSYLINPDGKVMGVNLGTTEIDELLQRRR